MKIRNKNISLAPTDLSNFHSCHHLTYLDTKNAKGLIERPSRYGPLLDELKARGIAHEQKYFEHLKSQGLSFVQINNSDSDNFSKETALEETIAAMRNGIDVIYQATLLDNTWLGRADFLHKVESSSKFGNWSYEVVDTKLARDTKAGTILQLCVYSYLLSKLQGTRPEFMCVVTPGSDFIPLKYRVDDYGAYFRFAENNITDFIESEEDTYPELVPHCDLCTWWSECEKRRRGDDHLCYVAGIRGSQIKSLRSLGIERLADLAHLENIPETPHGSREALTRVRDQAKVQFIGRDKSGSYYEFIEPFNSEHGLAMLPEPTQDDIFLDFEGSHFVEQGVQEYLTGFLTLDPDGNQNYTALWARTLEEECRSFEEFIDIAIDACMRNQNAHIYHFASYEPTALKRLMGRFATRGEELDDLLRREAFVDLYTIVKRTLIASVERYSIKDLEPFFGYSRSQDLAEATMSRRIVENIIESGDIDDANQKHFQIVESYNREDCESAKRLRDWLEKLREEVISNGHVLPRPDIKTGDASEEISELDSELQRLRDGLLQEVPMEPEDRSDEQQARFTLAHMMEFHRREDKAAWWEYFRVLDLDQSDYVDERRALINLKFEKVVDAKRAPLQRYSFVPQELDVRRNDDVYDSEGNKVGKVTDVNYSARTIDIKKMIATADEHPNSVVFHNQVSSKALRESLMRFGESVLEQGFNGQLPYSSGLELLLCNSSPLAGDNGSLQQVNESTLDAACRLALNLDHHVLAIQGPPGTGKTYTGAHIICVLIQQGLKVGVTAVSHKVIENLLEGAMEEAHKQGINLQGVHRQDGEYQGNWNIERKKDYRTIRRQLDDGSIDVLGATAWCWVREEFEQSVDVLIVDEAGQMSLSNVLAASPGSKGLVLLGDPQQLEQPLQSSHPEGSEVSALYYLLDGEDTMPADKGLFLNETFRLHPSICQFTSEVYYEKRLIAQPDLINQEIIFLLDKTSRISGSGLRYVPVVHTGNQARSLEEVAVISEIVKDLLEGGSWKDKEHNVTTLTEQDILIVAPYNSQVAALIEALPMLQNRIGTVDRFQGQEAALVLYSMTSSSAEDAPRGMEFLYDRHRFNVATSRARALCILVGSPALFDPDCKTPRQMRRVNGFCRYMEMTKKISMCDSF